MERKLLKKQNYKLVLLCAALMTFGLLEAQTVSYFWDPAEPNVFNFELTNGYGDPNIQHFTSSTNYRLQISTTQNFANGTFDNLELFTLNNPPVGDGASSSYQRSFSIPHNHPLNFHTYSTVYMRVLTIGPTVRINGIPVQVIRDLEFSALEPGFIQCQTPAFTYRDITITNRGNTTDKFAINFTNSLPGKFAADAYNFTFNQITETPYLSAGNSYSFIIRVYLVGGTNPGDSNDTTVILSSLHSSFVDQTIFNTTAYCGSGNGNNNPEMPGAPDLSVTMTLINESNQVVNNFANVGGEYRYQIIFRSTLENVGNRNPSMVATLPDNVEIGNMTVSYSTAINASNLNYTLVGNVLNVTYLTGNNQNNFLKNSSGPITFEIEITIKCDVNGDTIDADAFVISNQGDSNINNDTASLSHTVNLSQNQTDVGLWLGDTSSDWFDCLNWNRGVVPNSAVDVTISSTATNQPVIDFASPLRPIGTVAQSGSITLNSGGILTMLGSSELHISGNWTNNGDFEPGNGTVAFVGFESDQNIFDITSEPIFYNIRVNVTNNFKVRVTNDQGLFVNNQLNLESGILRLEGMSQLIQPDGATVVANTGKLWRDQQGQANLYNYNYWSSPVGTSDTHYTVAGVMKDGTTGVPQNITWVGGHNGAPTSPISISTHWLYKFESTGPLYANWQKINQNTSIQAGLGYTMKGSGAAGGSQNYTFEGVPFTGDIEQIISDGQISLVGNPYASAIDANQFIIDNDGIIDGTLEFWDHFQTTNSHVLAMYKGGYAKYNLSGGIEAVNSDNQTSPREPQRFIPVGQGFFVAAANGIQNNSRIVFKNSQRAFVRENDTDGMQMFGSPEGANSNPVNLEEPTRIRLNMVSSDNYTHQIAIGFMGDKATEGIDYGYDAVLRETDPNQFYFMHPEAKLLIQGVGYFDEDKKYPLGVMAELQGRHTFSIDKIENLSENTPVYLYDNEKQIYHNLRNSDYLVSLAKGEHNTRFSLRFKNHNLDNTQNSQEMLNNIVVYRQNNQAVIYNPSEQLTILNARMYNVLGQEVSAWNISNGRDSYIELPLRPLAAGIYVVQVQTDNGVVSKKINIR